MRLRNIGGTSAGAIGAVAAAAMEYGLRTGRNPKARERMAWLHQELAQRTDQGASRLDAMFCGDPGTAPLLDALKGALNSQPAAILGLIKAALPTLPGNARRALWLAAGATALEMLAGAGLGWLLTAGCSPGVQGFATALAAVASLAFAGWWNLKASLVQAVPLSALAGDNLIASSARTPWYKGPSVLSYLEEVGESPSIPLLEKGEETPPFLGREDGRDGYGRLPVQWVCRPNLDFRGFAGTVCAGAFAVGEEVAVLPSGKRSRIARIVTQSGDLDSARRGQAVTLTLADEVDISRGDVIWAWGQNSQPNPGRGRFVPRPAFPDANAALSKWKALTAPKQIHRDRHRMDVMREQVHRCEWRELSWQQSRPLEVGESQLQRHRSR